MSLRPAHPMTRNDSTLWSSSTSGGRTLLASTLFAAALSSSALAQSNSIRLWGDNSSSQCTAIPTGMGIVTSLTGGNYHTVALNDAGTVFCWGRNTDGQSTVPAALGSAQAIAAGSYHTVALKTDGTVACWGPSAGPNFFGQCAVPAGLSGVVGVAAGWKHTIVLKSDGTIVGWGTNDSTQLTVPADVGAVTQLVAGARHNLARRSNGTVRAWGRNVELQAPASLTHTNVTAVAAGASHSVALIGDGTLRCWGSNLQGQCNGSSLTGVVGIAAGGSHTAALKADGSVVTFGLASSSTVPTVPPLGIATRVAAGGFHTGAIIAAAPTAVLVSTSPASCNDANGSIDVTVSLADTTSWTGPNGFTASTVDLVAVVAGQYTLTATGPGGSVVLPVTVAADPDLINPVVLSYTANLEASAGQSCTAPMANFASLVVASDNCSGAITVTQSPAAGAATALGVQAVTITVRDAAGNEVLLNATFTVTGHATLCFRDQDVDSFGNPSISGLFCVAPLGYVLNDDDCDDDDNYVHPGQDEECDGEDDDCDSFIDEDMPPHVYYRDADGDSFGDERISVTTCADVPPPGFVVDATDCNDESAAVHPGAAETCSDLPIDNNCNGSTSPSEANDRILFYGDADADGAGDPAVTQLACTQPTGFVANANDQCPNDGALQAPREYYRDFDGDTFGDRNTSTTVCSTVPPAGYVAIAGDCDDARLLYADTDGDGHGAGAPVPCGVQSNDDLCPDNAGLLAPITYYLDLDGDGYGNALVSAAFCSTTAPAGYTTDSTDCNDSSAATHPGAAELCADIGTDNNCNGSSTDVDANAADLVDFFRDFDNDNYSINVIARFCPGTVNAGYLATLSSPIDCNDNNAAINPGATEICDPANTDEDCDGLADNDDPSAADAGKTTFYADADSDTYSGSTTARFCDLPAGYEVGDDGDCNDNNPAINPGATEICDELNTDEDCDRLADNDDPSADAATKTTFYADIDADGFSGATTGNFCDLPDGYEVGNDGDCNDINAAINPGATEICDLNNTDEDCDGLADNADPSAADAGKTDFYADADSDTYSGATIGRFCDLPFGYELTDEGDCNDTDAAIHPGASERCNGLDDDCNSIIDDGVTFKPYYQDLDGDNLGNPAVTQSTCTGIPPVGFVLDNSDCDDSNAAIHGPTIFYADADNDGAGDPAFPEVACTQPVGFVANLNDACPANGDLIALATYYLDEDHDGFGVETFTTTNCESNPREGYSRVAGDGCPEDANKQAPGACGCGNADTDSDNDGTADCIDGCPTDPNKVAPGACGCGIADTDSDGDGTRDCNDGCPNDPNKTAPGTCGCGVSDVDSDSDGTPDCNDGCPTDPNKTAPGTCGCGIPDTDSDSDGTADCNDGCPTDPNKTAPGACGCGTPDTDSDGDLTPDCNDGCPNDSSKTAPGACGCGIPDTDSDGDGTPNCNDNCPTDPNKTEPGTCGCGIADTDSDNDGTADCKDGCPNDTNKQEPGTCGCGTPDTDSDGNGTSDCADFVFTLDPNCVAVAQGNTLCVRVSSSWPLVAAPDRVTAVQLAVLFNQTRLRLDSVNNAFVGGPFDLELMEIIDNALGTLKYAAGIQDGSAGMTDASPIVELNFTVLPGVSDCDATGLLDIVSNIGPVVTRLTSQTGSNVIVRVPVDLPLPTIGLDFAPPTIAGLPEAITVPTDAGILFGGTVLEPTVTASDDCDAEVAVAMLITYPDLSISTVWPADNLFPRANGGVSTVQITATDDAGNFSVETLTITVGDYQHFNANLALGGAILGDSTRPIQLEIAGLPSADFAVLFVRANGAIVDFHVPVALGYGCATARDVTHSLRDAKTPAIVDREYSASFLLLQGNSNEDEQIDIFDFSLFVFDRVLDPVATNARSNFNADTFVTNADFTFLSINFFQVDETCDPGFTAPTPVTRVAVKELRRRGLGHLAAADFNGDGWVDLNDVQLYMQGAGPEPARPDNARVRPDLRPRW